MNLTEATVAEFARQMIQQVERNGGPPLDLTEDSLRLLDLLFRRNDSDFGNLSEAQRQVTVFYNGCFLGCALAEILRGSWVFADEWPDAMLIISRNDGSGVLVRPFERVWRRLEEGEEGNAFFAYYEEIKALARPAPVAGSTTA